MAWTTPKTWNVGEVLTASNMNSQLRDNMNFLHGTTVFAKPTMSAATGGTGTLIMAGLAVYFTPQTPNGNVRFISNCSITGRSGAAGLRYGTGTAPVNGAAVTGTDPMNGNINHVGGGGAGCVLVGHATSLALGVQYWADMVWGDDGAGTSQALAIVFQVVEENY